MRVESTSSQWQRSNGPREAHLAARESTRWQKVGRNGPEELSDMLVFKGKDTGAVKFNRQGLWVGQVCDTIYGW